MRRFALESSNRTAGVSRDSWPDRFAGFLVGWRAEAGSVILAGWRGEEQVEGRQQGCR